MPFHKFIVRTMSVAYLIRAYIFGGILAGAVIWFFEYNMQGDQAVAAHIISAYFFVSFLLYPFTRYMYESVVGYVLGGMVIIANLKDMFMTKVFTMLLCLVFSIFLFPIFLLILYFYYLAKSKDGTIDAMIVAEEQERLNKERIAEEAKAIREQNAARAAEIKAQKEAAKKGNEAIENNN